MSNIKLLSSAPTLDAITDAIERFHMGEPRALRDNGDGTYAVLNHRNEEIEGLRVVKKGKRYRSEAVEGV